MDIDFIKYKREYVYDLLKDGFSWVAIKRELKLFNCDGKRLSKKQINELLGIDYDSLNKHNKKYLKYI